MSRRTLLLIARGVTSLGLFAVLAYILDPRDVSARLMDLDPAWVVIALVVSIAQVVGSAWRWRFTASRLNLDLPMRRAVTEYYLATFLNQVLPGGVMGDVSRAWRHAREADTRASIQSVAFERMSGLVVMSAVAAVSAILLLSDVSSEARAGLAFLVLGLIAWGGVSARRVRQRAEAPQLLVDVRRALLDGVALPVQLVTSTAVVASYLAVFVMAGRAVQLETPPLLLAMLAGPLLMTMLVPVTIAGWGLREVAAAALWSAAGLSAADGVAVSVSYGLIVLVSSVPGAVVLGLTLLRSEDRDRTADPIPDGSGVPEGAGPRRESVPPEV